MNIKINDTLKTRIKIIDPGRILPADSIVTVFDINHTDIVVRDDGGRLFYVSKQYSYDAFKKV